MGQHRPTDRPGQRLHIVVTCTNRKTAVPRSHLRLGAVTGSTTAALRRRWTARLAREKQSTASARETYAGEHWSVATTLPDQSARPDETQLWVASAGYGLIPSEASIAPYSATFTPGHVDSVPGLPAAASDWWREIATWEGPCPGTNRTLADLAQSDPHATLVVVLSPPYLRACRQDILAAAERLDVDEQLTIVSVGADRSGPIAELLVDADGRLQGLLGGSKLSLNARVAGYMIRNGLLGRSQASEHLRQLTRTLPEPVVFSRTPMADAEVGAFISRQLANDPGTSATRLLRALRDSGLACEQHRFHRLYRDFVGGADGRQN
jgi:hypothetical protein